MGWIFRWILELIGCGYAYFLIFDMMMWHVGIRGCKTWILYHILIEFNPNIKNYQKIQFFFNIYIHLKEFNIYVLDPPPLTWEINKFLKVH